MKFTFQVERQSKHTPTYTHMHVCQEGTNSMDENEAGQWNEVQ